MTPMILQYKHVEGHYQSVVHFASGHWTGFGPLLGSIPLRDGNDARQELDYCDISYVESGGGGRTLAKTTAPPKRFAG